MKSLLQSSWLPACIGVLGYCSVTWLALDTSGLGARPSHDVAARETTPQPSWNYENPELEQLLREVKEERESVRARAQQLNDLQARLEAERQEIGAVTQRVYQLQAELDRTFTRVKESEQANIKKLAKMYATMSPEGAARILRELDEDQAVKIFAVMKESESAAILEAVAKDGGSDAKRAAAIVDRLRLIVTRAGDPKPGTL